MSEQTAETTATGAEATTQQATDESTEQKATETVEFWRDKAKLQEKRAKENKAAADELAALKESQKSEAEKSADRMKQLEADLSAARTEALRFKVASQYGIDDEDADLFLTGSDEDSLTAQAKRLSARADERKKQGNHVPTEGNSKAPKADDERAAVRALFGNGA